MNAIHSLIEPILNSPQLPQLIEVLNQRLSEERRRRDEFYEEISPSQKAEFIDGQVIMHSPVRNRHLQTTGCVARLLSTYVDLHDLGTVRSEKCLCVFPRNDYEPDVVFFGPTKAKTFSADTLKFPVPDLVVEVLSESTEARDRGVKFEDFAVNGVGEYWILDPFSETAEQYWLERGQFDLYIKSDSGTLHCRSIEGLSVFIPALFDEQQNLAALRSILQSANID